ncbi:MAG: acetyl-CoA carboxylase carboxyl transferase subunit alpha [Candidatus Neomarinimicrobiota bacterium]|nr:MAG: acetyl-CoA carboxylase carboxyl transferase subunit alpha [Candidatus Neomarinimicrobiota bacterium]
MAKLTLDFEKPILELEQKIEEMRELSRVNGVDLHDEILKFEEKLKKLVKKTYSGLNRWQRVQLARHPDRPYTLDYIDKIFTDFIEIHGDRHFADDKSIIAGFAGIGDFKVVIIGHQKGRNIKENVYRNFGSPHPEGYRKALRAMKLAEKFHKPVISFIDTQGAYPGIGAEERGQAEAIARNLFEMSRLRTPILICVIGEGASGGALGIGVGDRNVVLENTWYSVISPEGCASILYRDAGKANIAAESMKVTAKDMFELGVADELVKEPDGSAHRNPDAMAKKLKEVILRNLNELCAIEIDELVRQRIEKYSRMGSWTEDK